MTALPATADVVIAGGGVIGLTTALALARVGQKVCVIERHQVGRQCSWAGGGMLSPVPPHVPVPEIEPLLQQSLDLYPQYCAALLDETGIDPEYWVCGARWVTPSGEQELPDMAQVRNPRLLKALRRALERHGALLVEHTAVQGWLLQADRLIGVETSGGNIACGQAVLAAGAWSGQLAPVSIKPTKGQMVLLRGEPGLLEHIRISEHAYLIPRRDGRILLGSTVENVGFDTTPTAEARVSLMESARRLWPQSAALVIESQWAGLRPRGLTNAPTVEAADHIRGLFYNTGHFRLGVTLAPASAQRMANLLLAKQ